MAKKSQKKISKAKHSTRKTAYEPPRLTREGNLRLISSMTL